MKEPLKNLAEFLNQRKVSKITVNDIIIPDLNSYEGIVKYGNGGGEEAYIRHFPKGFSKETEILHNQKFFCIYAESSDGKIHDIVKIAAESLERGYFKLLNDNTVEIGFENCGVVHSYLGI